MEQSIKVVYSFIDEFVKHNAIKVKVFNDHMYVVDSKANFSFKSGDKLNFRLVSLKDGEPVETIVEKNLNREEAAKELYSHPDLWGICEVPIKWGNES